ncbi:translocation/assembly module TamB domain-containing protein [Pseudorhizobium tarimense]|nr:translocation/assembly module TamB domain-containing protein [Pseudorhizobium tarimense]MCJ8520232.1 translocation/assembly module TamB [Pseudorhizobium tarimense]
MVPLLKWIAMIVGAALAILLLMGLGVVLFVGLTPVGGRIAAERVSQIISTPDRTVTISRPEGLLSGDLHLDELTLSDSQGPYAHLSGIDVDWSPTALLNGVFRAENVSVRDINVLRAPEPSEVTEPVTNESGSGFSLPVGVKVAQIHMPDIDLGPALSGRDSSLSLQGSIDATGPDIAVDLQARRKDEPDARASVDLLYAPAENRLSIDATVSEPEGGLLARLLRLPGAPAVDLALQGQGPLSDWSGDLTGSVSGEQVIDVNAKHMMLPDGSRSIAVTGGGQLAELLPPALRPLFQGATSIDVAANVSPAGRIAIDSGEISSDAVNGVASGVWDPKGENSLTASLTGTNGPVQIAWPVAGQQSEFTVDTINFTLNGAATSARFNATAAIPAADLPFGSFRQIRLQAESEDLNIAERSGSIRTRLRVGETDFADEQIDRVVQGPVTLDAPLRLDLPAIGLDASTFDSGRVSGTVSGAYNTATQQVSGNFRLTADPAALPPTLAGRFENKITAEGYVERTGEGNMTVENIVLTSNAIEAHGSASLQDKQLTANLAGRIPEIGRWVENAGGAAGFELSAQGPLNVLSVNAVVNSAEARLAGRALEDLQVTVNGTADPQSPSGEIAATGTIDGQPLRINADLVSSDGRTVAPEIEAEVGPNRLNGALSFSPGFVPEGTINFEFPDVSLLAALAAQEAEGDLSGSVTFTKGENATSATVQATGSRISRGQLAVVEPTVDLTIPDISQLAADGTIRAARIGTETAAVTALDLDFNYENGATEVALEAQYDDAPLTAEATVRTGEELTVALQSFAAAPRGIQLRLASPTTVTVVDGGARLSDLTLATGDGEISVTGTVGQGLDVRAEIDRLPASLINTFVPAINAAGAISGTISAKGSLTAPSIQYDLEWSDAQLQQTRDVGVGPLNLQASGSFSDNTLLLEETRLAGGGGLDVSADGRVVLNENAPPTLDVNARLGSVPASLANAFVPALGAGGTISGDIVAGGTPEQPTARYDLTWSDAAVSQTASAGLSPLQVRATGEYAGDSVTLNTSLSGQSSLSLSGGGTISLTGDRSLDLNFQGRIPFEVLAGQLANQGFVLEGTGNVDLAVSGTPSAPSITGSASASGARLIDVRRNIAIEDLTANVTFNGNQAVISNLSGELATGGNISVSGTVGILPGSGFPADLTITLDDATYVDGSIVSATADGTLTLTGPLTGGPLLAGTVTLDEAAIAVPAKLPTSLAEVDVRHRRPPPAVVKQVAKLQPEKAEGTSVPLGLDLTLNAPNGIFVRGRGIDAELGGDLTITGTTAAPIVSGAFEMRRGRIIILTKRLDFTSGRITFGGGLVPVLDLEATTTSAQTTITVNVEGLANDPEISFSSSPALPQDEVLARLIFGQSMSRLSPLQIAQLADAVSQLAGGGSTSLLQTLRSNLGVDDLDINTDSTGQTTVSVGRYLNDRTYLQLEQGGAAGAQATINLDIGRGVKLKAGAGTEGGTAGIFYEREY